MYRSSLDCVFEKGNNLYYRVSNADGKVWYISNKDVKISLQLYQPSSFKGKIFKLIFPFIKSFPVIYKSLGVTNHHYSISPAFNNLMCNLFKVDEVAISVFEGTPSVHQKMTIQVSCKKNILGYCKVSDKYDIKAIFKHEQQVLDALKNRDVKHIPECIYCGPLEGNMDLFVQTTTKTNYSKIVHQMTKYHWDFLSHFFIQTKHPLSFEESDFSNMLVVLSQQLKRLSGHDASVVKDALARVKKHFESKEVIFSGYQGDFTPWNMFVEKGKLFVFDWEYAKYSYPPFLDAYHFFTQTCIFEKRMNAEAIYTLYISQKNTFAKYVENPDLLYQCYLLGIIALYMNRDKGVFSDDIKHLLNVWIQLIRLLPDAAN